MWRYVSQTGVSLRLFITGLDQSIVVVWAIVDWWLLITLPALSVIGKLIPLGSAWLALLHCPPLPDSPSAGGRHKPHMPAVGMFKFFDCVRLIAAGTHTLCSVCTTAMWPCVRITGFRCVVCITCASFSAVRLEVFLTLGHNVSCISYLVFSSIIWWMWNLKF